VEFFLTLTSIWEDGIQSSCRLADCASIANSSYFGLGAGKN
jgi:hypothetical protein